MKKTLGAVLVVAMVCIAGYFLLQKKTVHTPGKMPALHIEGNVVDLISFSIPENTKVSNGQEITGSIKGAYFFEANAVGKLLDVNKKELKSFPITATSEWMTADAVDFSFIIDTTDVPAGQGYIRIANDNPSGDFANEKYVDVPVIF